MFVLFCVEIYTYIRVYLLTVCLFFSFSSFSCWICCHLCHRRGKIVEMKDLDEKKTYKQQCSRKTKTKNVNVLRNVHTWYFSLDQVFLFFFLFAQMKQFNYIDIENQWTFASITIFRCLMPMKTKNKSLLHCDKKFCFRRMIC